MTLTSSENLDAPADHTARQWLRERRTEYQQQRDAWAVRESHWSWARLVIFLAAVALVFVLARQPLLLGGMAASAVVLFVLAVRTHQRALAQREAADRLLLVTDEALTRSGGHVTCVRAWQRPPNADADDHALPTLLEPGAVSPLTEQERDDLDVFAPPVGVFGLLNRTSTAVGARRLRDTLERPFRTAERILARQQAVRWLADHGRERLQMMAATAALRGEDQRLSGLIQAVAGAQPLPLPVPAWILRVWSLLSAAFTVVVIVQATMGAFGWGGWLIALMVVNGLIYARMRPALARSLEPWEDVAWAAKAYHIAARQAASDLPADTELARLRACCAEVVPRDVLPRLRRRVEWSEWGGLVQVLLNILVFADLHIALGVLKCAIRHRARLLAGVSALAELDMLNSLASFAAEQPVACYPVPAKDTTISITGGRHPLVAPQRVVPNDVSLTPATRVWIVTGSNMAGKSTFLRMVGINVLLAQVGCAAAAEEMSWSPMCLITDLRARDNLAEEESYFLAEVRHLRRMVLPSAEQRPLLGLIDEPFRGTNSQDQSAASIAVLHHLSRSSDLFLLATHDRHLTTLADGEQLRNHHFREDLSSDKLVFDYRLHEGPARTRNALRILEREGYPAELVAQAYKWLEETSRPDE